MAKRYIFDSIGALLDTDDYDIDTDATAAGGDALSFYSGDAGRVLFNFSLAFSPTGASVLRTIAPTVPTTLTPADAGT